MTPDSAMKQLMAEGTSPPPPPPKSAAPSAPINLPPQDEVGPAYMQHRQDLEGRAAMSSLMAEGAPAKAAAPGSDAEKQPETPETGNYPYSGIVGPLKSMAKDIGVGLTEAPRQAILEGPRNAVQSMLSGATDLGETLEKSIGTGGLKYNIPGLPGYDKNQPAGISPVGSQELQSLHRPGEGSQLPDFGQAKTVTGGLFETAGQFVTSMATVGRLLGPMGTDVDGVLGKLATAGKSAVALFAGFKKAQGNLADLIEQNPSLSNPITRFLQSNPGDNEAAGRLRNAIANVGFGELQGSLLKGLGLLRDGLATQQHVAELPEEALTPQPGADTPAAFKFLGDPDAAPEAPLAEIKPLEAEKDFRAGQAVSGLTPEEVKAQAGEPKVYINFARIDTPEDVKTTMQQLADAQKGNIDIAKRGIQTFEDTKLGADFTDAWKTLMERRIGEPLNDSEMLAGRQLLAQSAMKADALTTMTLENPTPENLFAWRKQMQTHAMIQAEVTGAQTEVARSLSAMRIPVSGQEAVDRMGALTTQLDQMGGMKSNLDFLQATKTLMDSGKLEDLGNVAEKTMYAKTRDALLTGWTNGLLTNPLTHVKVNLSNIGTIALRLAETRFAEGMDALTDTDGVPAGEAAQTAAGLVSGIKDSFRYLGSLAGLTEAPENSPLQYATKAFQTGHYSVGQEGGIDWAQQGQEASNALSIADSGWVGKGTDLLSSAVTSPGRALAGEHEFYRSIGMRMELNRFAFRQAIDELNSGKIKDGDLAGRVAQLVETPTQNISTAAINGMTYQTFTDAPGKLAEAIGNIREQFPLTRVILPFYKIPSRIMSFTFERTPLAPLMQGWRADVAAGGARQSMALAKTGLGSMVMLAASDAVLNGQITGGGPADKGQRQALMDTGWLPYSVKLPSGRWVQYNRLETVGSSMAMAADMTETIRDYYSAVNVDDPNVEKLTAAGIATLANNVTSKTYFEGLARFFDTISDPRANAQGFAKSLAGSLVPSGVGAIAKLMDPYTRATYSMMDAIKANTPGVSKDLPPLRNLWGEPVRHDSGLGKAFDAFVPFASRRPGDEPIDKEIMAQGMHVTPPAAKTSMGGTTVDLSHDPHMYSRYQELAGNELKRPGPQGNIGLKDRLNAIVSGTDALSPLYSMRSDGPDGGKALMIRGIIEEYRRDAKDQVLAENQHLQDKVEQAQQRHAALTLQAANP